MDKKNIDELMKEPSKLSEREEKLIQELAEAGISEEEFMNKLPLIFTPAGKKPTEDQMYSLMESIKDVLVAQKKGEEDV
jgi:hypothetical protein